MTSRIRQMFGEDLAGRIDVASYEAGQSSAEFVRDAIERSTAEQLEDVACHREDSISAFALGLYVGVLLAFVLSGLFLRMTS